MLLIPCSDPEHQTKVTEPNTHDAANLENQTEMTEPDMHTATDHTVNKENSVPNHQHECNPKSKLCIAISKVIGVDKGLIQLDSVYLKLKQMKQSHIKPPHHFVESYERILAQFKHKILKERAEIRHELSTYERDYYARHHFVPTEEDSPHFKRLVTRRNLANKLLQSWGIKL